VIPEKGVGSLFRMEVPVEMRRFTVLGLLTLAAMGVRAAGQQESPANAVPASCERLATLALPHTTITSAQMVEAGGFTPPGAARGQGPAGAGRGGALYSSLPAFCRVAATLRPSSDSDIKIEVWLPIASAGGSGGWNGKFQAVGNGGWAGTISYGALALAVSAGYASASTDTGHSGNSAEFALGHPEKVIDIGYRAVHEMTIKAKAIIEAHYGKPANLSFWNGCSLGGRQGLAEAQRYPADYDAIVAGAPAWNNIHLHAGRLAVNQAVNKTPESYVPPGKYPVIHRAVVEACDAKDAVKDGVLENPMQCRFDPKALQCQGADGPTCLTAPQVESVRALYAPVKHPRTGAVIYPGVRHGSELSFGVIGGPEPISTALGAFKYVVFGDANWDWRRFNLATDVDFADTKDQGVLATADANLKPFFDRGGKLLIYHGWNDTQVAPDNSLIYFNNVVARLGKSVVGKSIQLYMVPGMNHCLGGVGTDTFNKMAAIEEWVEKGKAPDRIIASHLIEGKVDRTRPLCPFGQVAKWNGAGSTDDAANFACVVDR
jgi:feruloyl esterase